MDYPSVKVIFGSIICGAFLGGCATAPTDDAPKILSLANSAKIKVDPSWSVYSGCMSEETSTCVFIPDCEQGVEAQDCFASVRAQMVQQGWSVTPGEPAPLFAAIKSLPDGRLDRLHTISMNILPQNDTHFTIVDVPREAFNAGSLIHFGLYKQTPSLIENK